MPLTPLQRQVIGVLRPFRTPHNYIGGGLALNQKWPRLSDDMDIFRDDADQLPDATKRELDALRDAGFSVEVTTCDQSMVEAILRQYGLETRVQWMDEPETCKRFFPALDDDLLGFRLHQADLAVNKVLCAARRDSAPRDAVDLVNIIRLYCPLGPLVWALSGKDSSLGPTRVIQEIRRVAFGYPDEEIRAVRMEKGSIITRAELREVLAKALDDASDYCDDAAPIDFLGHLFVDSEETPIAATNADIANGKASAIPARDFSIVPRIGG